MKSKTMILMGVAITCGLGASYMTSRLLADRNETVTVLVTKQKLSPWTVIKDPPSMFEVREMPKKDAPKTAILKMEDLQGRILLRALPENQAVMAEDLQPTDKVGMDSTLPPGKRALAIKVDATKVAGGFVLPGSHVDVIHVGRHGSDQVDAKVILEDILVRAVDLQSVKPEDKPGMVPATVTLEVTKDQALALTAVQDTGMITLALRPVGEPDSKTELPVPPKPPVVVAPPPPPPKEPPPAPKKEVVQHKTLTIYNGPHWTQADFVTKDGETTTEIHGSQPDTSPVAVTPPPSPPAAPEAAAKGPDSGKGDAQQAKGGKVPPQQAAKGA